LRITGRPWKEQTNLITPKAIGISCPGCPVVYVMPPSGLRLQLWKTLKKAYFTFLNEKAPYANDSKVKLAVGYQP
jgi:hypothetical protein